MSGLVVDLLLEGQPLRTVSFDRPVLRIGRMRENDLALDDLAVSRFHARLHLESGRVFLEDGGSENGSWVNGQRVRGRVELAPGDRIAIGKHELRVRSRHVGETALDDAPTIPPEALRAVEEPPLALPAEEPEPMSDATRDRDDFDFSPAELSADVEEPAFAAAAELAAAELDAGEDGDEPPATVLLAEEDVDEAPAAAVPAPAPVLVAPAPQLYAGLIVQREGKIERVVPWDDDAFTVGRSSDCDLVLEQDEVSRRHARFVRSGDRYEVHDLGSVNGTLVNGRRADRHVLAVGDVIAVESFQLTFVLDREPITTAMKPAPARPPQSAEAAGRDTFAMTILQEEMPQPALDAPAAASASAATSTASAAFPPTPSPDATIANVTLEEDLEVPDGLDLGFDDAAVDERKELAAAQPRGSSRAASVQDLGPAAGAPAASITLELRLRIDQLPEPLRRALEEAGAADLVIPADVRLRSA